MGTHPKGQSLVIVDEDRIPLQQFIDRQPTFLLGQEVVQRFGAALPYLFKVLAASQPLSIQAHPSRQQAQKGFARENKEGKALDAPDRNYRDDNHKPEIICALTPFWALNGFRPVAEAAALLAPVCPDGLKDVWQHLKKEGESSLRLFFETMMTLPAEKRTKAGAEVLIKARPLAEQSPVYGWMVKLAGAYPADMGVLSPALLNLIRLKPRQAIYLPAGQLHAYLDGVGVELMANSDNVLRGGLTPKHVDMPELLRVVRFAETPIMILEAMPAGTAESIYQCPAEEFSLSIIRTASKRPYVSPSIRSVEILLCTDGQGSIEAGMQGEMKIKRGDNLLVPAAIDHYTVHGHVTLYKAAVPLPRQ